MKKETIKPVSAERLDRVKELVATNSLNTCEYIRGYQNIKSNITLKCLVHNHIFETKFENIRHVGKSHYCCPLCQAEAKEKRYAKSRQIVTCAYCGKVFTKPKGKLDNSRSGLYFCCREHKDLAQCLDAGEAFTVIRPNHYGDGINYRDIAFRTYEHKCACCGWDEDIRILEVHHIDSNREHNYVENLVILCPICHRKITLGYYLYDSINKCLIKIR